MRKSRTSEAAEVIDFHSHANRCSRGERKKLAKGTKISIFALLIFIMTTLSVSMSIATLAIETAQAQLYLGRGVVVHYHIYHIPLLGATVLLTAYGPQYNTWYRTHIDWVFHSTPWIQFPAGTLYNGALVRACVTNFDNYGAQSCGYSYVRYGNVDVYIKMR